MEEGRKEIKVSVEQMLPLVSNNNVEVRNYVEKVRKMEEQKVKVERIIDKYNKSQMQCLSHDSLILPDHDYHSV
jgi:hypothetical protein